MTPLHPGAAATTAAAPGTTTYLGNCTVTIIPWMHCHPFRFPMPMAASLCMPI